jgi:hypothetical protein
VKLVYFTAGTKGAGHLVRGVAIGRALERAGFAGEYAIVAPQKPPFPAMREALDDLGIEIVALDAEALIDPDRAAGTELAARLGELAPDLLLVDMFWVPLRFILDDLGCPAWLMLRSCPPVWLTGPDGVRFAPEQYERMMAIEPIDGGGLELEPIDPVVVCNPDELRSRDELCERFRLDPARRIVAVSHAGLRGEIHRLLTLDQLGPVAQLLRFDLYTGRGVFPLAPWLGAADEIHSSAGYNSYWEARWLGYAPRTKLTAIPRTFDDPVWRVRTCGSYRMRENGADAIARSIVERL